MRTREKSELHRLCANRIEELSIFLQENSWRAFCWICWVVCSVTRWCSVCAKRPPGCWGQCGQSHMVHSCISTASLGHFISTHFWCRFQVKHYSAHRTNAYQFTHLKRLIRCCRDVLIRNYVVHFYFVDISTFRSKRTALNVTPHVVLK